ncbi:MAG: hypothetical protein ABF379_10275 [Akkermansiaceae bacterium]
MNKAVSKYGLPELPDEAIVTHAFTRRNSLWNDTANHVSEGKDLDS